MRNELLNEIISYLDYEYCMTGKKRELVNYKEVEPPKDYEDYESLYEGGDYAYDEEENKYYLCEFKEVNDER